MLQRLIELWDQNMPENGMIHDVILRSEHSLLEDEETKEVKLIIAPAEGEQPAASVFLYELEPGKSCEVEIELEYPGLDLSEQGERLWEQAREIVAEVSLSEKKRFLAPGQLAEATFILDYHFVVECSDEEGTEKIIKQAASDLGKLLGL
ncbi:MULTISPECIES: hypothetical protein [Brevibacillus]|jgi:hypothetical protein|uniref:Uncharacterized protein n=1 Tax=Brevibacillus borstelensis AK1 TaxID=1300222 RepID=M8DMG5_9BACL|nr:hypothetical protein [Brevibacillus borstelensis]EMT54838.1 hypothetical protein I532_04500 [Brevibacillus borstelensis AK1]KKX52682.1 hypothetical protein X546_23745 [Brevibacillus borstelensis cifa_chp40]MBE5394288.1 hypothetical protein [Brevibacillus borstelensis]MCC0565229.1 hypothetical protein [Brevibacillus borstelensis]MCM3471969.1 hypothetical protein [Brevibacillus borstelensis]